MAHAYSCDVAERDYSIASTQLGLANARRQIKVLEVQRGALSDDMETARSACEVLFAQLAEEQESGDALKSELSNLQKALQIAAHGLSGADAEISRLTDKISTAERHARVTIEAGKKGSCEALAHAEMKLAEALRREAQLEQSLMRERELKEKLEEVLAQERAKTSNYTDKSRGATAEVVKLRRELTDQRGAVHELQRLLAERDGAAAVLKEQLADAERRRLNANVTTDQGVHVRLQDVQRRASEMARELGSKTAALKALERQIGEQTAETASERNKAENYHIQVRELEAVMTANGLSMPDAPLQGKNWISSVSASKQGGSITKPAGEIVQVKAVHTSNCIAKTPSRPYSGEGLSGSPKSLFTEEVAKETVLNVLDHLSLSGYVSPLAKTHQISTAFDDIETEGVDAVCIMRKLGPYRQTMTDQSEPANHIVVPTTSNMVSIDINASYDPSASEEAERSEGKEAEKPEVHKVATHMRDELEMKDNDTNFKLTRRSKRVMQKSPKSVAMREKTPAFIGGLRMPLANIHRPQTSEAPIPKGDDRNIALGAGKKKRRLLNHLTLDGPDAVQASLIFGTGDEFCVPE